MSSKKRKQKNIDEEQDILKKSEYIISLEQSIKDSNDKTYIDFIKYIFTQEFTKTSISLPVAKKVDKDAFQYLKNFVNIIYILFQKEEERHKIYTSEISSKIIGNDLFNHLYILSLLVERKKIDEIINNGNNLKDKVNQIFCNYIKSMNKTVLDSINLYFYYLGFFIQSINSFKLLLYYFLKIHKRLQIFEYKDYCPDLDNSNCLNLIILFYKNINNKPIETLFVYAFLIFNYKKVCDDLEDNIEPSILEKSINQTSELVKRKTLDNSIIFEYINVAFYDNIHNNIYVKYSKFKRRKNNKVKDEIILNDEEDKKASTLNEIKDNNSDNDEDKEETKENSKIHNKSINKVTNDNNNISKDINIDSLEINIEDNKENFKSIEKESNKSLEIINLINIIKNIQKIGDEHYKEIKNENKKLNDELDDVKAKLKKATELIDNIRFKKKFKNILKTYEYLLDNEDIKIIEKNKNKKWELIANKIKANYKQYEKSNTYQFFVEILNESVEKISKINEDIYQINLNNYIKNENYDEIKEKMIQALIKGISIEELFK